MSRDGRRRRSLAAGLSLLAALVLLALAGPALVGDPQEVDADRILVPPGPAAPAGTDALGRDVLARLVHGARPSLYAGFVATACAVAIGFALGAAAGLAGRALDTLLVRGADVVDAFPPLVGAVALLGAAPWSARAAPGLRVGLVVGLLAWPRLFRFVRAEVRRLAAAEVTLAARAAGGGRVRVALRHLLPLAAGPALVPAAFLAAGAILVEAGLGYLGLGVRAPWPSWGNLLVEGMAHASAWWLVLFPGIFIFLTVLAFHLVGEGLTPEDR